MGRQRKKRYCKECGQPVPEGRKDRLYCSDACKNRHNYEAKQMSRECRRNIIGSLDRNHKILSDLVRKKVESMELTELLYRGFCPDFMTCCRRKARYNECGCFDIVYNLTDNRIFSISKICV